MDTIDPLIADTTLNDPFPYYAELRERHPVHRLPGTDAYLITTPGLIHEVVGDPDTYSSAVAHFLHVRQDGSLDLRQAGPEGISADAIPQVLATADPPRHTRQRKALSRLFATRAINAMESNTHTLAGTLLEPHLRTGRIDWVTEFAEPLAATVLARLLGLDDETATFLRNFGFASLEDISGFVDGGRLDEVRMSMVDLGPVAEAYALALAGQGPGPDTVLGVCAEAVGSGQLDEMEVITVLLTLVSAGSDSTSSLLGTGALLLARDGALQERLRAEPALLPAFIEETCRIEPPFRGHYRRTTRSVVLGGVTLPQGATLILAWPAANRDPDLWDKPDVVNLDRPGIRRHVGFGAGLHLCIGAPLARLEARVAFESLLSSTTWVSLDAGNDPLPYQRSLMVRRLSNLRLKLE